MTPKTYFSIQQLGRETDIYIFGEITSTRWSQSDVSAFSLAQELQDVDADTLNVYIDSPGGEVSEGWAIYHQLKKHPARVRTHGVGFVASAALYPFLAGDERYAVEPSAYFLHQVSLGAAGDSEDLRAAADTADLMTEIGLAPFVQSGVDAERVREMMRHDTWLSPKEALDCGIATSIVTPRPDAGMMQSARTLIINRMLAQHGPDPAPRTIQPLMDGAAITTQQSILADTDDPVPHTSGIMQMLAGVFNN